jgi:hypothetical protein
MLEQTFFIIRNGAFGTDFGSKLFLTIIGLFICFYDWKSEKRKDYFWVFLFGTLIWGGAELFLQLTGIREMSQNFLFSFPIPIWFASFLRGTSEGAVVAIIGLFFGDRLLKKDNKRKFWFLFLIGFILFMVIKAIMQGMPTKLIGGDVSSRRDLLALPSILFLSMVTIFDFIWLYKSKPKIRKRAVSMFLMMVIPFLFWTFAEWYANTRWVEFGSLGNLALASYPLTLFWFLFDVIIEIGIMYVPFLALPYLFGLIKKKDK